MSHLINPKSLRLVDFDEIHGVRFIDSSDRTVVFPSYESFLEALVSNGKQLIYTEDMLRKFSIGINHYIKELGSLEEVVKHMYPILTEEELDEEKVASVEEFDCMLFIYTDYIVAGGYKYEEIVKPMINELFTQHDLYFKYNITPEMLNNTIEYNVLDKNSDTYVLGLPSEYGVNIDTYIFTLSEDDRNTYQKAKAEKDMETTSRLLLKALTLLCKEILDNFS